MNTRLFRSYGLFSLLLFFLGLPTTRSLAADFPPVNPDELKITSLTGQPGAPAFVLYHEEVDDDKLHYHQVYMRIKVLTEAGREYANVELPYNGRRGNISEIHGRTIHPDGTIIPFEGKPFEKVVLKGRDLKYKVKAFTLPDVQVGSIVEYRYTFHYDDNLVFPPRWVLQNDLYQQNEYYSYNPYDRDVLLTHGRIGSGYAWTWSTPHNEQPVRWPTGRIDIRLKDVPAFKEDEFMPPAELLKHYVFFYYSTARSVPQFWQEEGKFWSKEVDHFASKSDVIASQLSSIIGPNDTPEQKVRKIYSFVGKLENTTYKPARSAEERVALGLKANKEAADVIRNKSGDRDDITRTFIAMVRQAGIPAFAFRVTARDGSYFLQQVMDFDQLDAEVAVVQLNGKEVFLDPGTRFCPYGMLYWKYSGAQGLRQTQDGKTQIAETEGLSYKDTQSIRRIDVKINAAGSAEGTMTVGYFGQESLRRRLKALVTDAAGRTKDLEEDAKGWLPSNTEVSVAAEPDWESDAPLVIKYKISAAVLGAAGKRLVMPAHLLAFTQRERFIHSERKYPIYFDYPYTEIDELHIELPDSLTLEALPAAAHVQLPYAAYASSFTNSGHQLVISRQLLVGGNVFPLTKYQELRTFFQQVHNSDQQQLLFKQSDQHASGN